MENSIQICQNSWGRKFLILTIIFLFSLSGVFSGCSWLSGDDSADAEGEVDNSSEIYNPIVLNQNPRAAWYEEGCDLSGYQPVTDLQIRAVPSLSKPQPRIAFIDPTFGTCVVRVTDRDSDLSEGDISGGMKNEYSRVQSFNADETFLIAFTTDGNWYLYDALNLQVLGQLPIYHEPRWDADDPDLLYYSEETRLCLSASQPGRSRWCMSLLRISPGRTFQPYG